MSHLERELSRLMKDRKQRDAYLWDDNCVVQAGPGSGKTATLTLKIMRLLAERISPPRGLACVTFNNEAVREFKVRLRLLGLPRRPNIFLGTVHSFCLGCVIRPFAPLFRAELPKPLRVGLQNIQDRYLQKAMDHTGIRSRLREFRFGFDRYRRTHVERGEESWLDNEQYARTIEDYESIMHKAGYVDFDDLILIALNMIEKEAYVRRCIYARFPWLVIDEYQDLGYPLHRMILAMLNSTPIKILAVGGPDQSIYGFIGADPKYLNELANRKDVTPIQLDLNYRCAQKIIDGSCVVLSPDVPRNYRSARDDSHLGEVFFVSRQNGLKDQAEFISERLIPQLVGGGYQLRDIALLYLDKNDARVIIDALEKGGIKYAGERDQRYPRTTVTRWVEEIAQWCCGVRGKEGVTFSAICDSWIGLLRNAGRRVGEENELLFRRELFRTLTALQDPLTQVERWLSKLEEEMSIKKVLGLDEKVPEELEAYTSMVSSFSEGGALASYKVEDLAGCGANANRLCVTTLHSSKGLQFDVVIIPGLEEGRLPSWAAKSDAAIREARRTFYVGFTRPRHLVYLIYSGWYENQYGVFKHGPSRFVVELMNALK